MFRKSVVAILILLYSASAIGMPLHFHYCRGELKHVTLFLKMECHEVTSEQISPNCCKKAQTLCESGPSWNNCCDDDTRWIQDNLPAICSKSPDPVIIAPATSTLPNLSISDELALAPFNTGLCEFIPLETPRYLAHCALIFYG